MSSCCRVTAYMIRNYCGYAWNYISINCLKKSQLAKVVYVNSNNRNDYRTILENFYLCNKIHTLQKLIEMIGFKFDDVLFVLNDNNTQICISRESNTVTVNGVTKRIILGDISLSYILG